MSDVAQLECYEVQAVVWDGVSYLVAYVNNDGVGTDTIRAVRIAVSTLGVVSSSTDFLVATDVGHPATIAVNNAGKSLIVYEQVYGPRTVSRADGAVVSPGAAVLDAGSPFAVFTPPALYARNPVVTTDGTKFLVASPRQDWATSVVTSAVGKIVTLGMPPTVSADIPIGMTSLSLGAGYNVAKATYLVTAVEGAVESPPVQLKGVYFDAAGNPTAGPAILIASGTGFHSSIASDPTWERPARRVRALDSPFAIRHPPRT